ncbi:hypothetical protein M758_UG049500 [Ceratodon purpureus]|nr:hypothetical protein M758_UG049500 [Ceratodon purpureus]
MSKSTSSPPLSAKVVTKDSVSFTGDVVVPSWAWGCSLVDAEGEPLVMSEDGTLTRMWNFAELDAELRAVELRLLHLEQFVLASVLSPVSSDDSIEALLSIPKVRHDKPGGGRPQLLTIENGDLNGEDDDDSGVGTPKPEAMLVLD